MTCKSRYFDAITTLFVFVTVTEIKCQGLQDDRPSPEFVQQDALPNMCLCLCDTCKFWDEQYRNMTYVELCCLEYHRFSPLSSDFANNNGNNIVWKTSYLYSDLPAPRTSPLAPESSEKTLHLQAADRASIE